VREAIVLSIAWAFALVGDATETTSTADAARLAKRFIVVFIASLPVCLRFFEIAGLRVEEPDVHLSMAPADKAESFYSAVLDVLYRRISSYFV
jgi:hypothetical protein